MSTSELPAIEVEIFIEAPPQRVWELVTDIVLVGEWSPEYDGGTWLDGATGAVVGARFSGRNHRRDREWETTSTVIEAEPGKSFAWAVGDPDNAAATWGFALTAEENGTRVRQHVQLGPGPSGITRRIAELPDRKEEVIAARTAEHLRNMQATLAGLKSAAE
jgi:uncharacterized protein YndB with AHSA1/START domain